MSIKHTPKELDKEALDKITDKVLNYRPKNRQPKPPKKKIKAKKAS